VRLKGVRFGGVYRKSRGVVLGGLNYGVCVDEG
jgi:hypothetical protein